MRTALRPVLLAAAALLLGSSVSLAQSSPVRSLEALDQPLWSPDGSRLALTGANATGVHVYDLRTNALVTVTEGLSSGYAMRWSPDGRRLAFKLFVPVAGAEFPLQVPAVYDVAQHLVVRLSTPVAQAGVPSFTADGRLAFTLGDQLQIVSESGATLARWPLGHYANLAPISPDGSAVAYNDANHSIWVLDVATGARTELTTEGGSWFNPQWSPDGKKLLVSHVGGRHLCFDLAAGRSYPLPRASAASWLADSETIVYASEIVGDGGPATNSDLHRIRFDGTADVNLTPTDEVRESAPSVSPDGSRVAFRIDEQGLVVAPLTAGGSSGAALGVPRALFPSAPAWTALGEPTPVEESPYGTRRDALTTVEITGVPHVNQVYDTPDDFNGQAACGPTSAIAVIAYHKAFVGLPAKPITVSTPTRHTSNWGDYVGHIYAFKGVTYNIGHATPSGRLGYGGYGYIWQNTGSGVDTKGNMARYFRNHGLTSSVDWSPSWTKLQNEVNDKQPFVVLTSITTSGHYKVVTGYYTAQHSLVLMDPAGNKALGYFNYSGARVVYDWPGYSNGKPNLKQVHCFIYGRGPIGPVTGTLKGVVYKAPDTAAVLSGATVVAGGKTATTGADGVYSFALVPGSYTVTVTKSGYDKGTLTRAVVAGTTVWGSVGLKPTVTTTTGTLKGIIYKAPNTADVLSGATVTVSGKTATTGADGVYSFALAPGSHTVTASKSGYANASVTRTVVASQVVWGSIGMSTSAAPLPAPVVQIDSPLNGATLQISSVTISGSVEDVAAGAKVQVKFGTQLASGTVAADGSFDVPIQLPPGDTTVEVSATNASGTGKKAILLHFKTGFCGVTQKTTDAEPEVLAGATVDLLPDGSTCSAPSKSVVSAATGKFCFDLAPGDYLVRVKAAGYVTAFQEVTVDADERLNVELALPPGTDPVPSVQILEPLPGEDGKIHVTDATVTLSGTGSGMTVSEVTLNGQALTLTDNEFTAPGLTVGEGETTFEFLAKGRCGETASVKAIVVRGSGTGTSPGAPVVADPDGGFGCSVGGGGLSLVGLVALAGLRRRRAR